MIMTYIAILRGINVSGQKMIKMDSLLQMFTSMGYENVQTYIQSGNVIFQTFVTTTQILEQCISSKINETFGFHVPVIIKEYNDLNEIASKNPFATVSDIDITKLHVTFLSSKPLQEDISNIPYETYLPDEFVIINTAIYLHCPNGYGKTRLNNNFFENKLKVIATTRNWKTVNELLSIVRNVSE